MHQKTATVPLLLSAALLTFSSPPTSAQLVDISGCRAIEDRLERFVCYENLEAGTTARPDSSAAPPAASRPATPTPARSVQPPVPATRSEAAPVPAEVGEFGRAGNEARVVEDEDGDRELHDTIAELSEIAPNIWLITLASGQQWRQMSGKRYIMREGDEVRIYPSIWGRSYRLTATRLSGYIQVERVR